MTTRTTYKSALDQQFSLPSAPIVVQKLNALLDSDRAGNAEVARVVETDQAFTARVLRVVNSPFYGFTRQITSVTEAITMLGLNTLHQLLLTTSMVNAFAGRIAGKQLTEFWRHSFGVGVLAKHILYNSGEDSRREAFIAGILHDMGRLVFMQMDVDTFTRFYYEELRALDLKAEEETFGIDHQQLGRLLAEKWNFPERLVAVIGGHHTPMDAVGPRSLTASVHLADLLAHTLNIGSSGTFYVAAFCPESWSIVAMSQQKLELVIRESLQEIESAGGLFRELAAP